MGATPVVKMPRELQIALLDDSHGVNNKAWVMMRRYVDDDIYMAHDTDGTRVWLNEGWDNGTG